MPVQKMAGNLLKVPCKSIRYRNINNGTRQQIKSNLKDIEGTHKIFVKSGKLNKMSPYKYKHMLHREVIKHFLKSSTSFRS